MNSKTVGVLGILFVIVGLALNQRTVEHLMVPDGEIESKALQGMIWLLELFLISTGILLIVFREQLIQRVRVGKNLLLFTVALLVSMLFAESLVRILGFEPWPGGVMNPRDIRIEPGKTFSAPHEILGHSLIPGAFRVTLPAGYSFDVTHSAEGTRITRPPNPSNPRRSARKLWVFGCSFTYGWGVDDEYTYPWLLQTALSNCDVVNYGVSGYSTVQSLLQFREALAKRGSPSAVILSYASFHDARNALSRSWRKQLSLYSELMKRDYPYGYIDDHGELALSTKLVTYTELPFMRTFAVANLLDELYNRVKSRAEESNRVSLRVISAFHSQAHKLRIPMILAGISDNPATAEMLRKARTMGLLTVDISVDLSIDEYSNRPYDNHPSPLAHRHYAERLLQAVTPFVRDVPGASPVANATTHSDQQPHEDFH